MRSLIAYIDSARVGTLSEDNNLWVFEYDPAWMATPRGFDLSPALTRNVRRHEDGSTLRPVQWYFDNLLPEEALRIAIAKEAYIRGADDAFALLEYLGAESAGSLTLLPPEVVVPKEYSVVALTDEELSARIRKIPRQTLTRDAPKRMSLAGAQHKMLLVVKDDGLYEPVGATPSTYILKPDHPELATYPASVFNEYLTMRLARAARLEVPPVQMRYVPEPVYLIERFDRVVDSKTLRLKGPIAPTVARRHVIDACQLLNKDRGFKHSGATLDALNQIIDRTINKAATRQALYRWLVFNIVVGNDDCHLKNLSFYIGPDGAELAPHYDLLSTGAYHTKAIAAEDARWNDVRMAFPLPGASTFGEVSLKAVLAAASELGLPEPAARRIVGQVTTRVAKEFEVIEAQLSQEMAKAPADRAATLAQQSRLLRAIGFITLPDMLNRLIQGEGNSG